MRTRGYPRYFVGLDLGQTNDPTAVAVVEDLRLLTGEVDPRSLIEAEERRLQLRFTERLALGTPYPAVVQRVLDVCWKLVPPPELSRRNSPLPVLVVDGTGVGRAVVDLLRVRNAPYTLMPVSITSGERESSRGGYRRVPKRDLVGCLITLLQTKGLRISEGVADYQALVRELLNFRVKFSTAGNDSYGNWRDADHDDLVLAVALAAWAARPRSAAGFAGHSAAGPLW